MSPVTLHVTRVDVNAQIAVVRSQLEKLAEFSTQNIGRKFPEIVEILARSNDDNTISSHLNTLDNLLCVRDSVIAELHKEASDMEDRLVRYTDRVNQFVMPKIQQSVNMKSKQ